MRARKKLAAFCNIIGIVILVVVIAACVPIAAPRFMGYQSYNIMSGSMEPDIPVGSLVYVKPIAPEDIVEGDVIAFSSNDSVVVHRTVENHIVEGEIITKGDANEDEDMAPVAYQSVLGRVERHIPYLGQLMLILGSGIGKVCMLCLAVCGILLNVLGGRLRQE
jgi:signal peptidase